jgi:hypothetical protein
MLGDCNQKEGMASILWDFFPKANNVFFQQVTPMLFWKFLTKSLCIFHLMTLALLPPLTWRLVEIAREKEKQRFLTKN